MALSKRDKIAIVIGVIIVLAIAVNTIVIITQKNAVTKEVSGKVEAKLLESGFVGLTVDSMYVEKASSSTFDATAFCTYNGKAYEIYLYVWKEGSEYLWESRQGLSELLQDYVENQQ